MLTSIHITTKMYSIFCDFYETLFVFESIFSSLSEWKNLESSRICKNRFMIILKIMSSSKMLHNLISWPEIEMIGVVEYNLRSHFIEILRSDSFHCCFGSNWHKNWSLYFPMSCLYFSSSCISISIFKRKFEHFFELFLKKKGTIVSFLIYLYELYRKILFSKLFFKSLSIFYERLISLFCLSRGIKLVSLYYVKGSMSPIWIVYFYFFNSFSFVF